MEYRPAVSARGLIGNDLAFLFEKEMENRRGSMKCRPNSACPFLFEADFFIVCRFVGDKDE